jgi:ribonuclease BN (tRNA processing enzyme)
MKIMFLGTNGWFSTEMGNTSCILIDSERHYVVLDAGDGIHKLDRYVKTKKPISLFLSHVHLDHIIGLHTRHPYTAPFSELPFKVELHDLPEGRYDLPFPFTCKLLFHPDPCVGYRFEIDNKVITYCTDTGICDNLYELSKNADLLISECGFKSDQVGAGWSHLKPEETANVAKQANVKQLVLIHFGANAYRTMADREQAEDTAKRLFKNTTAAYDGLEMEF